MVLAAWALHVHSPALVSIADVPVDRFSKDDQQNHGHHDDRQSGKHADLFGLDKRYPWVENVEIGMNIGCLKPQIEARW